MPSDEWIWRVMGVFLLVGNFAQVVLCGLRSIYQNVWTNGENS